MRKRVVITGLGVVAPNGIGKEEFWRANINGVSGVDYINSFDVSMFRSKIAGQVKNFDPLNYMPIDVAKKVDRFVHLGLASASLACADSKLDLENEDKNRIGVIIGSGLGGIPFHEEQILLGYEKGAHRLNPFSVQRISPNAISSHISIQYGLKGQNLVISTACSSGAQAVGIAFRAIQHDEASIVFAGGAEAPLTQFTFGAYCSMHALSKRNDSPQAASRPFDKERDGFVMSEGAAILILEELQHALKRDAHIYAEIVGYGSTASAYHMVIPEPEGNDAAEAMNLAIKDAGISPEQIDYINAHGTSTQLNDTAETKAIKKAFGDQAYKIPISSTKSMIGHTIGAAGAIETLVCSLIIQNGIIPPTINYQHKDADCDLDYVPNKFRTSIVKIALSNSFGFGGNNACVVTRRY